jgi:hypothetical protein
MLLAEAASSATSLSTKGNEVAFEALRGLFNKSTIPVRSSDRMTLVGPRIPRHSSGWSAMLEHLKDGESLRVLDVGPTSSSNVNFLTGLGHSIYMADVVTEANGGDWIKAPGDDGTPSEVDLDGFFERHLDFNGRVFDVVLLWTTLDYLPERLLEPLIARLHSSLQPQARVLAFFHTKTAGPESIFYRYHVTGGDAIEMQEAERLPVRQVYTNRRIEKLFSAYASCKFFLAKDNVSEVIIVR